jgi:hypothetical protein
MDTVERSAITSEKDAQRQDGDVEMGGGREQDHEASAIGNLSIHQMYYMVVQPQ